MKALKASVLLLALLLVACESGIGPTEPPPPQLNCDVGDLRAECADSVSRPNHGEGKGDVGDEE